VAGAQDIRRRIRSVKNMQQITKAMKMVSAAKLRKAQLKLNAARPYARQLQGVLERLAQAPVDVIHPLLKKTACAKGSLCADNVRPWSLWRVQREPHP